MEFTDFSKINSSSYPNCIKYHELDIAKGCSVKCIYCGLAFSDNNVQHVNVDIKEIAKQVKTLDIEGIYLCPNTDAFSKKCADTTHDILEYFLPKGIKFLLITKCIIPQKTIQLLAKYHEQITIKVSLARLDKDLIEYIEPGAASAEDRLGTMKTLIDAGIEKVQALLMPLYPSVDDDKVKIIDIVDKINETGVRLVKAAYVVIRKGEKIKDITIINKMLNHPKLKKSWELMTEIQKIQIGEGQIYPREKRFDFYKMLYNICDDRDMKFSACCVLDSALISLLKHSCEFDISKSVFPICNKLQFLPDLLKK